MRFALTIALLALAMAGTAAAQPSMTAPGIPFAQPVQQPGEQLSEDTARWISLGSTISSWSLLLVGAMVHSPDNDYAGTTATIVADSMLATGALGTLLAPSLGHWYAHSFATRGLGLRVAGAASVVAGFAYVGLNCGGDCSNAESYLAGGLALTGVTIYLIGTVDDIMTASNEARRYNYRFQNVAIAPMIGRDNRGFMITGRF